ncbi:MAG: methyltransferase FkbM family, partial [Phycisphaerales bacterium]|nr:methyltransferase FkbM family [Phycisphaerales bacterium]
MGLARSALERVSRRLVFKRRLPARFGGTPMYVSPDAGLRYWKRSLDGADPMLLEAAAELVHAGDHVWDIGANVGLFSFAAASVAGTSGSVLSVEPDMWLAGLLRRSSALPPGSRAPVNVLPVAIDQAVGVAKLHVAARGRASNSLSAERANDGTAGGVRDIQLVPTVTLDWLLDHFPHPRVVKIDVEGLEDRVLAGGRRLLAQVRPAVVCEVSEANADKVAALFASADYQLFDASAPAGKRTLVPRPVWNTLALP